jgi:hypothetical protein
VTTTRLPTTTSSTDSGATMACPDAWVVPLLRAADVRPATSSGSPGPSQARGPDVSVIATVGVPRRVRMCGREWAALTASRPPRSAGAVSDAACSVV